MLREIQVMEITRAYLTAGLMRVDKLPTLESILPIKKEVKRIDRSEIREAIAGAMRYHNERK